MVTAGANKTRHVGVLYHSLRIQRYAYGSVGLGKDLTSDADDCIFPNGGLTTQFGAEIKTKCRLPLMTGALGSTFIAPKYWDSFATFCSGNYLGDLEARLIVNPGASTLAICCYSLNFSQRSSAVLSSGFCHLPGISFAR